MKMQESGEDGINVDTLIYGTVEGSIGVVASLDKEHFAFFQKVQNALTEVIKGIGGFEHKEYPVFSSSPSFLLNPTLGDHSRMTERQWRQRDFWTEI